MTNVTSFGIGQITIALWGTLPHRADSPKHQLALPEFMGVAFSFLPFYKWVSFIVIFLISKHAFNKNIIRSNDKSQPPDPRSVVI